ncbi:lysophospholipase [Trametes coccinea BRFM310]|uniref:Lysophospholipase n=1 Tax=Trametes coccinea (strain BRFM310) TaxID=1353009 RepID=A0A1Y2IHV4_TRAC3|nr:lysophospholipase [Trametes coccinea BRFM310]
MKTCSLVTCVLAFFLPHTLAAAQSIAAKQYAPVLQPCPASIDLVRSVGSDPQSQKLSLEEAHYIHSRQSSILPTAWVDYYLNVLHDTSQLLPLYITQILLGSLGLDALPNLGIATSGGGLRAALFGAGVLSVLDGRNQTSVQAGTGGLLQTAKYLSGLSGGSWLVLSLAQADFPMLPELIFGTTPAGAGGDSFGGWLPQFDILEPGADANATAAFVGTLLEEASLKRAAGFPVTITDIWGRSLARHFVNGTTADDFFDANLPHGAGITLSSVPDVPSFRNYEQPFPIVLANSVAGQPDPSAIVINESGVVVPLANPIYEFNVYETGSFDAVLGAFTPTQYLGSPNSSICATGFDQISFIEGVSSTLFNTFNTSTAALLSSSIGPLIEGINQTMPQSGIRLDSAQVPNPFRGVAKGTFMDTDSAMLTLVDGGEDGETTPFQPLLVQARGIDTIIAIDAVNTSDNWAAGDSLIATQERVKLLSPAYSFPPVPSTQEEFLAQNLTKRPTFFGCNSPPSVGDPLVIYIANGGPPLGQAPLTNTSTGQLTYTPEGAQRFLDQVYDIATQGLPLSASDGSLVKDPEWPACLACAVVDRARRRLGFERAGICVGCFERYCWS